MVDRELTPNPAFDADGTGVAKDIREEGQTETGYNDEALDPIVEDNIEIDFRVGADDDFRVVNNKIFPLDSARSYNIVELEIVLTNGSASNYMMGEIVGDGHNQLPGTGTRYSRDDPGDGPAEIVTIDIDTDLMEVRPNTAGEITRVFTGVISNSSRMTEGRFEFMAFWPGFNRIQNGALNFSPPPPAVRSANDVDYTSRQTTTGEVADNIGDFVTKNSKFEYSVNLENNGTQITENRRAGFDTKMVLDGVYSVDITTENSDGALTTLIQRADAVWDVTRYGEFSIGPPEPDGAIPTAATSHKLRYLTEADAGRQSPMYRSIEVIGSGVASRVGYSANAQVSEKPLRVIGEITQTEDEQTAVIFEGDAPPSIDITEPVYTYRNMEINTIEEAEHTFNKIADELRQQLAGGEVTVVGHPEVWPGDAVELPNAPRQPFAEERFIINKVRHRLNNNDGFLTTIEVGGQTDAARSLFDEPGLTPKYEYLSLSDEDRRSIAGRVP